MRCDGCQGAIVIQQQGQLMVIADVPRGHVLSLERYPAFIMSQVAFARAGPPSSKMHSFFFFLAGEKLLTGHIVKLSRYRGYVLDTHRNPFLNTTEDGSSRTEQMLISRSSSSCLSFRTVT